MILVCPNQTEMLWHNLKQNVHAWKLFIVAEFFKNSTKKSGQIYKC